MFFCGQVTLRSINTENATLFPVGAMVHSLVHVLDLVLKKFDSLYLEGTNAIFMADLKAILSAPKVDAGTEVKNFKKRKAQFPEVIALFTRLMAEMTDEELEVKTEEELVQIEGMLISLVQYF